ncbi:glyoxalase [Streptococcus danieliae]|uniref:glyoxalase n=1 Tax=Streptococcus danieliae TaxID=747656 RepID=UPI0026F21A64|nr:glyoxalase [Streptococcus danieliae]
MFRKDFGLMLYVADVAAEKVFWSAAGFVIISESEMMGFDTFDMKPHADSTVTITVFAKEFIQQVSPEVADNVPSILFEVDEIEALHENISALTDTCSPVTEMPFKIFNFASPSGLYFAVKGN